MEIIGKVKKILETQTFGSGFQKREVVITTNEQYPQHIIIEFTQDRISLLDTVQEGNDVKISINIRGREWINPEGITKYFNSINGWRIEKMPQETPNSSQENFIPPTPTESNPQQDTTNTNKDEEENDLPF